MARHPRLGCAQPHARWDDQQQLGQPLSGLLRPSGNAAVKIRCLVRRSGTSCGLPLTSAFTNEQHSRDGSGVASQQCCK